MRSTTRTASTKVLRELDHRNVDGIDVRLLWVPDTNRVAIAVADERSGELVGFYVDSADALDAFHNPYAYAEDHRSMTPAEIAGHLGRTP